MQECIEGGAWLTQEQGLFRSSQTLLFPKNLAPAGTPAWALGAKKHRIFSDRSQDAAECALSLA